MNNATSSLRGLYAITPTILCEDSPALLLAIRAALEGGARLVQYRDKSGNRERRMVQARALSELCHGHGARLIVNDDIELAEFSGADGVHLGAADPPLERAREQLGPDAILGASCGPSLQRALDARAAGADYVAFGRFHPSRTKPEAPLATLEVLRRARADLAPMSICAIGGVTPAHAPALIAAGADLIAAVEGVFGDPQPQAVHAAASAYAACFR